MLLRPGSEHLPNPKTYAKSNPHKPFRHMSEYAVSGSMWLPLLQRENHRDRWSWLVLKWWWHLFLTNHCGFWVWHLVDLLLGERNQQFCFVWHRSCTLWKQLARPLNLCIIIIRQHGRCCQTSPECSQSTHTLREGSQPPRHHSSTSV